MQYTKEILDNIHAVQIEILKEVISICERNNIQYFSMGGTTLGAIRHSGFIPWDDDIDIGMMRTDYEKFLVLAQRELSSGYVLQYFHTEPNCATYFAKIRKDNTVFLEEYMKDLDIHKGIYIDIKPFDYVPENKWRFLIYKLNVKVREQFFLAKVLNDVGKYHSNSLGYLCRSLIRKIIHIAVIPFNRKQLYKSLERTLKKYETRKTNVIAFRAEKKTVALETDYFPVKQHQFEGVDINIPQNEKKILINQFGLDYMKEKRQSNNSHMPIEIKY